MSAPLAEAKKPVKKKAAFPWLAIVCLLVTVFIFWGLPLVNKNSGPVQVDFEKPSK